MKKRILIVLLVIVILAVGCAKTDANQTTASTTAANTTAATEGPKDETTAPAESGETSATEETSPETTATPQPEATEAHTDDGMSGYMDTLEAQSNALKASLQQEELTQAELNRISQELYELWDNALNDLWAKLRDSLPEEEFDKLLDEQLTWIEDKETAVAEAGKPYEGGSIYPLIVNSEAAKITEDRVAELYQLLK